MKLKGLFAWSVSIVFCILALVATTGHAQTPDTTLAYGTYLGASGSDNEAIAIAINPQRELVVAINMGTDGWIHRYTRDGQTLISSTDVGGRIDDMDINRNNGDIAVVGDFGLKVFDSTASAAYADRSHTLGTGTKRVGISTKGVVVTSAGDTVSLWSQAGTLMSSATTEDMSGKTDRHVHDVAISAEHGNVYVGGYRQASSTYQSPFLYAFEDDLSTISWKAYDYWQSLVDAAKPYTLGADSRLYSIAIGRDNGLYILGEAHGGTTVFKTNGVIPASNDGADLTYIQPVEIDNWNKMHDTNSAVKTFFGKVNPQTGVVEQGQFLLPRWNDGDKAGAGSSTRNYRTNNGSIAADEEGNVYVGGAAGTYIKGRYEGTLTINGTPIGSEIPESDKEMAIYIVDPSFSTRKTWTVLTKDKGDGSVTGFDAAYGISAFVGTSPSGQLVTTAQAQGPTAYNATNADVDDAYFGILTTGKQATGQPPVVSDIPDQSTIPGRTFSTIVLDEYVSDADSAHTSDKMTWSYSGNAELEVRISDDRIAMITMPNSSWVGEEIIIFTATDPEGLSGSDSASFKVTAGQAPVIGDIPEQHIKEGESFAPINLQSYVSDSDHAPEQLTWAVNSNPHLDVSIDEQHVATISPLLADWVGKQTITFTVTDPHGLTDSATVTFAVSSGRPIVNDIPNQSIVIGTTFATIELDSYVEDPNHAPSQMTWSASDNSVLNITIDENRIATITISQAGWEGAETVTFTANDPSGLSASDTATFEVATNHPPTTHNDSAITDIHTPVTVDLIANDQDDEDSIDPASISIITYSTDTPSAPYGEDIYGPGNPDNPHNGIIEINTNGTILYIPTGAYSGTKTFTYTVRDTRGATSNASTVTMVIKAHADDPNFVERTTTYSTTVATTSIITPTFDGIAIDENSIKVIGAPQHGTATPYIDSDNNDAMFIRYTPIATFTGTDRFIYSFTERQITLARDTMLADSGAWWCTRSQAMRSTPDASAGMAATVRTWYVTAMMHVADPPPDNGDTEEPEPEPEPEPVDDSPTVYLPLIQR